MRNVLHNRHLICTEDWTKDELDQVIGLALGGNYWWKDLKGVYRSCNEKLIQLLGLNSVNDIIGKTDYELPWQESANLLIENDNLAISSKEAFIREEKVIDAAGQQRVFQVTKVP